MKKTFFASLIFSLSLIVLISGCSKKQTSPKLEDPNNLSEDELFVELVTETYDYLLVVTDNIKKGNMKQIEVQNGLQAIQAKNLSYDDQMKEIDILFKSDFSVRLQSHMKTYDKIWNTLKKKYKNISPDILSSECSDVLFKKYSKNNTANVGLGSRESFALDCGFRYYLCAGAATAGAILCHAACDTTAVATTAGLGIPVCVAACGTIQAYAMVVCADSYCS